jgi:hypothetical protein
LKAALIQGAHVFTASIPPNCLQYLRLNYTVATGPLTAGKFTAALAMDGRAGAQPVRTGLGARV